ncbi:MAG: triose-phosphate isomerase, partial [Myxococcota bacterium]|nr:triose-phosphate isomerase [Myxococcota bacterium]
AIAPPFTALAAVREAIRAEPVSLAAQDVFHRPLGAFTGEISPAMLVDVGCRYVIVGHSERRHVIGESDELVGLKVRAALDNDLVPILCVGETIEEREAGRTLEVVERQLAAGTAALEPAAASRLVFAYEPVWAIGTGKVASAGDAQEVHAFVRRRLAATIGSASDLTRILYGGSVKADNAAGLFAKTDIDGALVGGASLRIADFGPIVDAAAASG